MSETLGLGPAGPPADCPSPSMAGSLGTEGGREGTFVLPKLLLGGGPMSTGSNWEDVLVAAQPSALIGREASLASLHGVSEGPMTGSIFVCT